MKVALYLRRSRDPYQRILWCRWDEHPILWHITQSYSPYGHRDFVSCLGYKASVIKEYFLNSNRRAYSDCTISDSAIGLRFSAKTARLAYCPHRYGVWRNIGQRLVAVRHLGEKEERCSRQLKRRAH
jgi:glucose-1-phosphate cytidylyltransferase